MSILSFDISTFTGDPATARITLSDEVGGGDIEVTVEVVNGTIADLRGLFFNISDESLVNGLSVSGGDVTDSLFRVNRANNTGGGNNMNGTQTDFDGAVEIGSPGIGNNDDIPSTTFVLSHNSVDLTLDLFENQDFGVRLTSVGANREGSSKLVGNPGDINFPPVAPNIGDQQNLDADSGISVDASFTDPDGDTLTYSVSGLPEGLSIDPATGEITGTIDNSASQGGPNNDGIYSVTVTADDGNGGITETTFSWDVDNPAPTATPNTNSITEDADPNTVTGNVLIDDDGNGVDSDPDGDDLSVTTTGDFVGTYGTLTLNPDGSYSYALDHTNPDVQALDEGQTLTDSFNYTNSDGEGGSASSTLTITINGANDNLPPDAVNNSYTVEANDNPGDNNSVDGNIITDDTGQGVDSDPDGDPLTLTANTNPGDGLVLVNPNGDFTYTPNDNFFGTDAFDYTIQDSEGATDTATVTINVIDPGRQTNTTPGTVNPGEENEQDVVIELTTEEQTANDSTFVEARITIPELQQPNFNIAYVIDVSGSTNNNFGGTVPGDQNGDGDNNDIIDAEIASFKALTESLLGTGFGNDEIDIGLISFSQTATFEGNFEPADPGDPTSINPALDTKLSSLLPNGLTNFDDALDKVVDFFNSQPDVGTATNILYFLSDGIPNVGGDGDGESGTGSNVGDNNPNALNYTSEIAALDGLNVQRVAIGVGTGSQLASLNLIDNTGGAEIVTSTDELTGALLGNPITGAELTAFDLLVNGTNVNSDASLIVTGDEPVTNFIDVNDLMSTALGFDFGPVTLSGLDPTVDHTITAQATFDDGTVLAVDNVITGALPVI